MEMVLVLLIVLAVAYKLGLFGPVIDLASVATRESSAYDREHKARVGKRYESLATDLNVKQINDNIKKIDSLRFD